MLEDIYKNNPRTVANVVTGLTVACAGLIGAGMIAKKKKNCKILFGMGLASLVSSLVIVARNRPIGVYGKNPQEVINWLKSEGFTNIPEAEIRKTGHYFWGK